MKDKRTYPEVTNVFEVALYQEFRKLQLGEPDKKIRKVIDRASKKVTSEVKRFMKDVRKLEEKKKKQELKKLRKDKTKSRTNKSTVQKSAPLMKRNEIVADIVA